MKRLVSILIASILGLTPVLAFAQSTDGGDATQTGDTTVNASSTVSFSNAFAFQRQGVFGCSLNGSYSMSVGALSAVGGAYVPVNDAAVTLNTGYLVYKECVLRGIVDRERENATAAIAKQILNTYAQGRNGQPYYSQDIDSEQVSASDKAIVQAFQNGMLGKVNPAFRTQVTRAIAQGYMSARNQSSNEFSCPYTGDLGAVLSGNPQGAFWDGFSSQLNVGCNPYSAYTLANAAMNQSAQRAIGNMMTRLQWYGGNYARTTTDANGNEIVVTPGSVLGSNALLAVQTGFQQLQNANDIDQMVGALFAGITSQVVGDNRGLAGLIQQTGSQPSYLDQVAAESTQGLRNSAINAALQILTASQQVEAGYKSAMEAIAQILVNTIGQLRSKESACWTLIIQKECAGPLAADNTCTANAGGCTTDPTTGQQTCPTGDKLKIATSTQFSQQVIDSQITPLASSTATGIQASVKAIGLITQLIQGVTNTSSLDAQRVALQQLDTLVAQKSLHTQYDLQNAQQQQKDLGSSMAQLITDTVTAWADSTDPNTGWCNVNQQAVIDYWHQRWKVTQ